jgi:hypothetical protein
MQNCCASPLFMRHLLILIIHLITTVFRLVRPGGLRAAVAESLDAKHQELILDRSRRRAPNLYVLDRLITGFCSLWIKPDRFRRVAIAFKPSTLLKFHPALVHRSGSSQDVWEVMAERDDGNDQTSGLSRLLQDA